MFLDINSLGVVGQDGQPATWKAEYDRLVASGLSATLVTSTQMTDGGSVGAQRNFDQRVLIEALLIRRAELDATFDDQVFALPCVKRRQSLGITIRLGH